MTTSIFLLIYLGVFFRILIMHYLNDFKKRTGTIRLELTPEIQKLQKMVAITYFIFGIILWPITFIITPINFLKSMFFGSSLAYNMVIYNFSLNLGKTLGLLNYKK